MSEITGRKNVERMKNEDVLVREISLLISELSEIRDKCCNEDKNNYFKREVLWKKIKDMSKTLRRERIYEQTR